MKRCLSRSMKIRRIQDRKWRRWRGVPTKKQQQVQHLAVFQVRIKYYIDSLGNWNWSQKSFCSTFLIWKMNHTDVFFYFDGTVTKHYLNVKYLLTSCYISFPNNFSYKAFIYITRCIICVSVVVASVFLRREPGDAPRMSQIHPPTQRRDLHRDRWPHLRGVWVWRPLVWRYKNGSEQFLFQKIMTLCCRF